MCDHRNAPRTIVQRLRSRALLAVLTAWAVGCGGDGLKTHPVNGRVVVEGGDVSDLAGCHVEFMLESEPTTRADGIIGRDGAFSLQTLYKGKILKGAAEGSHRARIVIGDTDDDDDAPRRRKGKRPVAARFLDFTNSGLTYEVPTQGEITVNLTAR